MAADKLQEAIALIATISSLRKPPEETMLTRVSRSQSLDRIQDK